MNTIADRVAEQLGNSGKPRKASHCAGLRRIAGRCLDRSGALTFAQHRHCRYTDPQSRAVSMGGAV